jgi:hypothetical protein
MISTIWQSVSRTTKIALVAFAIFLAGAAASGGCYAHRPQGAAPAASAALPYAVSVVPWTAAADSGRDRDAFARTLASLLENSAAFKQVHLNATPAESAELVAISTGLSCESSVVPVFTILTAGIIPTVFEGERCDGLILRSSKGGAAPPVEIRVRDNAQVVIGWPALVFGLLPGWSFGVAGDDDAYAMRVRDEIAKHRPAIDALATQKPLEPFASPASASSTNDGTPVTAK